MIFQLPEKGIGFPDPMSIPAHMHEPDGLFAIGGDLSPRRLIEAYSQGIFPWSSFRDLRKDSDETPTFWNQLHWYCPMRRFVIFPDEIHISHSMRTLINKGTYRATIDKEFARVILNCSRLRIDQPGAWLGKDMVKAYTRLHAMGFAHSVEVWEGDNLVGGLYGVSISKVFMGESMFSLAPSASKLALVHLCGLMLRHGGKFIDCQFETPHLRSMGGRYIPYSEYIDLMYPMD